MIVIDIGCADHGNEMYSIERLIKRFHPKTLYGFDPLDPAGHADRIEDTDVFINLTGWGRAAWVHNGEIGFSGNGAIAHIDEDNGPMTGLHRKVPCFDLAKFIESLEGEIVLKIDAEGAEYPLLEHLIATKADARLSLALIEWHDKMANGRSLRRQAIEEQISCPLEEWLF